MPRSSRASTPTLDADALADVDAAARDGIPRRVRGRASRNSATPDCMTRPAARRSGSSRCCARSSTRHGICRAGCTCPTRRCPHFSTKEPIVKPDGFVADLHRKPEVLQPARDITDAREPLGRPSYRPTSSGWSCSAWGPRPTPAAWPRPACARTASSRRRNWRRRDCCPRGVRERWSWRRQPSGGSVETLDALNRLPEAVTHRRADEHGGLGHHGTLRRSRRRSTPNLRWAASRAAATSTRLRLLMALECHLTGTDTEALAAVRRGGRDRERSPARLPNPIGVQRFPSYYWAPTVATWRRRRIGSARRSRAR